MKIKFLLPLIFSIMCVLPSFAQISTLTEESRAELNQQLRFTARQIDDIEATRATTTYVDGKFDTTTGHDHDGTDSKTALATNLDMTGITDTHILYNNAGTLAGKSFGYSGGSYVESEVSTETTIDTTTPTKKYQWLFLSIPQI